jgi:hypothetical protein
MKTAIAVLVGQLRISLDPANMTAKTPEDLMAGVRAYLTIAYEGGVHFIMTPRVSPGKQVW